MAGPPLQRFDRVADAELAGLDDGAFDRSVATGEASRFAPGEFQSWLNDGADPAVVLALGAPRHSRVLRIPLTYPACGCGDGPRVRVR